MKASYPKRLLVHSSTLPAISSAPHGLAPLRGGSLAGYEPTGEVWPISLSLVLQRFWSKRSPHGYRQLTFGARVPARPADFLTLARSFRSISLPPAYAALSAVILSETIGCSSFVSEL